MKQLLLVAGAGLGLSACAPTLAPHVPHLPMVHAKGETEINLSAGLTGAQLAVGYQATDHLVVSGALLWLKNADKYREFRSAELGLGYYQSLANSPWRLGLHTGLAHGRGRSGYDDFCLDLCDDYSISTYNVRYWCGYVQPTALFIAEGGTMGFGVRVGRTYYTRLDEQETYLLNIAGADSTVVRSHAGHGSTFMQPVMQFSYRVQPWLMFSGTAGVQFFVGQNTPLNDMAPFIWQVGAHFVLNAKPFDPSSPGYRRRLPQTRWWWW